jgi:hypothetical protein
MVGVVRNGLLQPAENAGIRAGKIFSKIFFILQIQIYTILFYSEQKPMFSRSKPTAYEIKFLICTGKKEYPSPGGRSVPLQV